jgi:hypothetical protein
MRLAYSILVGKPEGRDHSEDLGADGKNIRMNLPEIGWDVVDWMHLTQDRGQWWDLVKTVIKFRVPLNFENS